MNAITKLTETLSIAFPNAETLEVVDTNNDGHHFTITIKSKQFNGVPLIKQHQLIYQVIDNLLATNEVHAVALKTIPSNK